MTGPVGSLEVVDDELGDGGEVRSAVEWAQVRERSAGHTRKDVAGRARRVVEPRPLPRLRRAQHLVVAAHDIAASGMRWAYTSVVLGAAS